MRRGFFKMVGGAARQDGAQLNSDGTRAPVEWQVGQVFSEGGFLELGAQPGRFGRWLCSRMTNRF